jgi:NDP-sugar pyrophosphorylase family protein
MNIIIGMAGAGSRFAEAGFTIPKPLCRTGNTTMIQKAVETLDIDGRYIFVVQHQHLLDYPWMEAHLKSLADEVDIITLDGVTEGAACSLLHAKELIDNDRPLISINSDQVLHWDSAKFLQACELEPDVSWIMTYPHNDIKHSFVALDNDGYVVEAAEKVAISNIATVGLYHWAKGSLFVKGAEEMIANNERHNGEFYLAPIYNYTTLDCRVKPYPVTAKEFTPVGTPSDLASYHTRFYRE